jgi:hypothetical protein
MKSGVGQIVGRGKADPQTWRFLGRHCDRRAREGSRGITGIGPLIACIQGGEVGVDFGWS